MLDADIAIYAMRGNARIDAAVRRAGEGRVAISALVHSQLLQGVPERSDPLLESRAIATLVRSLGIMPYETDASHAYGRIIDAIGFNRRHAVDRMIAAHAISLDATLVTNNVSDFADIPDLSVTNWTAG